MNFKSWSEEMNKSWTEAQQQYWKNLTGMDSSTKDGNATTEIPAFMEGLEKWWLLVNPQTPVSANEVMNRVFEMGKAYTQCAEDAVGAQHTGKNPLEAWLDVMEKGFRDWAGQAAENAGNVAETSGQTLWQEQLQALLKTLGMNPDLSQANQEALNTLAEQYQQALQKYMDAFSGQGLDSVKVLRERMDQMARDGASIDSLRELYDLWVDVSEEVYGRFAMSEQYQEIYGEMINASVALKSGVDGLLETQLKTLNIPTHSDLDAVIKRQQAIARENAALQTQVRELSERVAASSEQTALQAQIQALTERVAALEQAKPVAVDKAEAAGSAAQAAPTPAEPDDLTRIKGLGPKTNNKLIDAGIQTFDQLAALSDEQAQALDKSLDTRGRLLRDDWVGQAARLSGSALA